MPLLDHFHPPMDEEYPWPSFHAYWAGAIAKLLNRGGLPPGYRAMPMLNRPGPIEIDVAALRWPRDPRAVNGSAGGPQWTPGEPAVAVAVELPTVDEAYVHVITDDGDPRLMAAIELVSPANKDRPESRAAFAAKCVDCLRRGAGVVVVDAVTTRHADLDAELLTALRAATEPVAADASHRAKADPLSTVAYRVVAQDRGKRLLAWPSPMKLGEPLPTVPLWVGDVAVVPLDLEASYALACADLIP